MAKSKQKQRTLIYLSSYDWRIKKQLDADQVEANHAKCLKVLGRKPDLEVAAILQSQGEPYPFDPAFNEFRRLVINRHVDCVIVPSISTLASNSQLAYQWVRDVMVPAGVRYLDASERFDSSTCSLEGYMHRVKSKSMRSVKPGGDLVVRRMSVPFGYIYDTSAESCMRIDDETEHIVKELFELACEPISCQAIADIMNQKGYITPSLRRIQLYGSKREPREVWETVNVRSIINNPMYTGAYVTQRTVHEPGTRSGSSHWLPVDKQPRIPGHHEPIVSKALFRKACKVRSRRGQHWPGPSKSMSKGGGGNGA